MKALSKCKSEFGIWKIETPIPEIGPKDVLIKIKKTAICGTDLHMYQWDEWSQKTVPVPMIIGHEYVGTIAAIGSQVNYLTIGMRVSGEGHITCGHCRNCQDKTRHLCKNQVSVGHHRQGAFAEYLSLPAENVIVLPEFISDDIGAILDPLGNAVHTVVSCDPKKENVLITGAGPIGLMAAKVAQHLGAQDVFIADVHPYRIELAHLMEIPNAMNVAKRSFEELLPDKAKQEGFWVGYEMSGHPKAIHDLLALLAPGACVGMLGLSSKPISLDWNEVIFKGLTLKGIYGRKMFETWDTMLELLQHGLDVSKVITHHFHVDDFEHAFKVAHAGQAGKVILAWE